MANKPNSAAGYSPGLAVETRRMALHIATVLGDLSEEVVIVGGLVPYLIIDQTRILEPHVGTRDLDLGLSIAVLDHERYREISQRLRDRGFVPATAPNGNLQRQTWRLREERVTIDFLIGPIPDGPPPGRLQSLEADFAAIVTPALPLAFMDTLDVLIESETLDGELARRSVRVAGPAAFVVLKAHAFRGRGEDKDAYDLVYMLLNYGEPPVAEVAARFASLADRPEAGEALAILAEDFASENHLGPMRRAAFLDDRADVSLRQDAFAVVQEFLRRVGIEGANQSSSQSLYS